MSVANERAAVDDARGTGAALLEIADLAVRFDSEQHGVTMPLQGVDLTVPQASRMALVGESGSGKSLTAAAALGMLPRGAEVVAGSIRLDGEELIGADERRLQELRGNRIAIMFQNPRGSLNPVLTVGGQIAELIRVHEGVGRRESKERAIDLLDQMGIADARRRAGDYAHQYSGGMAQRAALAMALSCRPELLIADEPTTGLDATLQQQVLELVVEQVEARNASLLLITHDIGIVGRTCDEVAVMYAGKILEAGKTDDVLANPQNPYTIELLRAFSVVNQRRMSSIPGRVPILASRLQNCAFAERCPRVGPECHDEVPQLRQVGDRRVACLKV
jgi:oligopeptide/dipeptide ABC transporter ATP-binding protein